jgi:hypothetical protein
MPSKVPKLRCDAQLGLHTRWSEPRAPRREPAGFAISFRSHPTLKFSAAASDAHLCRAQEQIHYSRFSRFSNRGCRFEATTEMGLYLRKPPPYPAELRDRMLLGAGSLRRSAR